jgi:putative pyruvate formate lyase activating enzyme
MNAMKPFFPAYFNLSTADLDKRAREAYSRLEQCDVCARNCRVNRLLNAVQQGICKTGLRFRITSYGVDMGEEAPIVGTKGSGTIFFGRLPMKFKFYQPYEIADSEDGVDMEPEQLAAIMLELQDNECHNLNLIAPSHVVPQILAALKIAVKAGLNLPLVYNSDGYDSMEMLRLLDGVVDIYIPDMRFSDPAAADRYLRVADYIQVNRAVVKEMHRQVGDLIMDDFGVAKHGLIVRHLVLPRNLAGTEEIARFLAREISPDTYFHLMRRYFPSLGRTFPEINRPITDTEYDSAIAWVKKAGLRRIDLGPLPRSPGPQPALTK